MTVHRLLMTPDDDGTTLFAEAPARADLIVVDEASMLDLHLAVRLTAAIPDGSHLLLVGDTDQLPSIGPGNVLADVLKVPDVPRVRLTKVFRQAEGSGIVRAAHLHPGRRPARACRGGAGSGSRRRAIPSWSPTGWCIWRPRGSRASRACRPTRCRCSARCGAG